MPQQTNEINEPERFGATIIGPDFDLTFDVTERESFDDKAKITNHPREAGTDISDHTRREPTNAMMTAFFTDTPLTLPPKKDRAKAAYDVFLSWIEKEVTIVSGFRVLDAVLKSVKMRPAVPAEQGLSIELGFQTIEVVSPQFIFLPVELLTPEPEARDLATPEVDAGPQSPPDATEAEITRVLGLLSEGSLGTLIVDGAVDVGADILALIPGAGI